MKTHRIFPLLSVFAVFIVSCNDASKSTSETEVTSTEAITNPLFTIAPVEYATLAEQSMNLLAAADFEAMLADSVEYDFPDGDQNTRTKLKGKEAVLAWWKNYRSMPAVASMTVSEFNNVPIDVTGDAKAGATKGIYVISYFNNTQVINGQ